MDELAALLPSDIWVRWRLLANNQGYVTLLGPGETPLAEGRVVDLERPAIDPSGSKLGMVAKAVLGQLGDWWSRGCNWDFRAPGGGQALFSVRPRTSRDAPNVFTVSAGDGAVIGTVSAHDPKRRRELRSDAGPACAYVPVPMSTFGDKVIHSYRATIVDGALVLATVFHDRDPDAVAGVVPTSGLIEAFDFGVAFAPGTDAGTRLLAVVAAILDTKVRLDSLGGGDGQGGPTVAKSRPAPGTNPHSAREQEASVRHEHQNDRLDQFQAKARRLGKEELAERLEKHRRGR